MLQQTQVATVIPYFLRWLDRFPDPATLAGATEDEVHGLWAGLGYYRRARSLQAAARVIAVQGWPLTLPGLLALPGLGPYTAAAVAAQAFQIAAPALDGNAFRVLARLLGVEDEPRRQAEALRVWLAPALASHGPSRLTQAVMELGATVCTPAPRCPLCPLQEACSARRQGAQARIPPPKARTKVTEASLRLLAISSPLGWLLRPPGATGLLAGLWSWPTVAPGSTGSAGVAEPRTPYGLEGHVLEGWVQVYSHRRETVRPLVARVAAQMAPPGLEWVLATRLQGVPMGRRDQRLREALAALHEAGGTATLLAGEDLEALAGLLKLE
jgi:A/G-specific adenine glycosylase